jgi:REP element-mobilizing transposase RayT
LLIDEIEICQVLKKCEFLAYKINPEHIHLIVHISLKGDLSEIMRSLRANFSRNANRILGKNKIPDKLLINHLPAEKEMLNEHISKLKLYREQFLSRANNTIKIPTFRWQSSFRDHVIRGRKEIVLYRKYIQKQSQKHNLKHNRWLWISRKIMNID